MDQMKFTILGCGSSGGVPRLGGNWGACDPAESKNRRLRCSLLVERISDAGKTTVLIDTSPDMREQLLTAGVGALDAVFYTHEHADHTHGLDDLRMIVINMRKMIPIYADATTQESLLRRFGYAFETPKGSPYPPILELNPIDGPITIDGAGGPITLEPFEVDHGNIKCTFFRINNVAYTPDISAIPDAARDNLSGLDVWLLDALRYTTHPSHANVEQALSWVSEFKPKQTILTNLHIDLDYETLCNETPESVTAAYDGMSVTVPI